jgi:parvulin-like peptidyl-prolyl isomerase
MNNISRSILSLLIICCTLYSYSQSSKAIKQQLKTVNTIDQAHRLKNENSDWHIEVLDININDTTVHKQIKSLKKGDIKTLKIDGAKYAYKLIDMDEFSEFRVSYVFLDGKKLSKNKIDSLRTLVIEKHDTGTSFTDLFKQYSSIEESNNGDLGWFKEGIMVREFENAVKAHKKGDIYTLDIPRLQWYFVVLKTHDDRVTKHIQLIKIKCSK